MSKKSVRQFWPLDYDPEGEVYESLSWDLPGFRPDPKVRPGTVRQKNAKKNRR
jgi:hypothetical protein